VTIGAAGKLGGQLPKLFPDQYAGITLSNDNSTINVYEVCSSPNMTRYAVSTAPVNAVRFLFVPNTFRELNRAFDELMSGNAALEHLVGVMVAGYGVDVPANLVNVQVINLTHQQLGQIVHVRRLISCKCKGSPSHRSAVNSKPQCRCHGDSVPCPNTGSLSRECLPTVVQPSLPLTSWEQRTMGRDLHDLRGERDPAADDRASFIRHTHQLGPDPRSGLRTRPYSIPYIAKPLSLDESDPVRLARSS